MSATLPCPACDAPTRADSLSGDVLTCGGCGVAFLPPSAPAVTIHTMVPGGSPVEAGRVDVPPWFHQRYRLGRVLGRGAMGTVIQGARIADSTLVAVKFLIRVDDPTQVERFAREGRLMRELQHPNVVAVLEVLDLGGYPCLVTEYLPGGTLRERMRPGKGMGSGEVLAALSGALAGLAACHDRDVVHRDLKPENILFDADDRAKIADLGIARAFDAQTHLTRTGMILGTPRYMSPEQALGEPAGAPADVYAMGCIAYEMLAGVPVFDGRLHELLEHHISSRPPPLDKLKSGLPPLVVDAVMQALAKRPGDRPANARDLAQALDRAAGNSSSRIARPAAPPGAKGAPAPKGAPPPKGASAAKPAPKSGPIPRPSQPVPAPVKPGLSVGQHPLVLAAAFLVAMSATYGVLRLQGRRRPAPVRVTMSLDERRKVILERRAKLGTPNNTITAADGAVMLRVPPDSLLSGPYPRAGARVIEVQVPGFAIDLTETTNAQYEKFVSATGWITTPERSGQGRVWDGRSLREMPKLDWRHPFAAAKAIGPAEARLPVVQVGWIDALAYAMWAGKRLPTELEWERAARGGRELEAYPWGDDPPESRAAFGDAGGLRPVGQFAPNAFGLLDMSGNAQELVADAFDERADELYIVENPQRSTFATARTLGHVARGGAYTSPAADLRCDRRALVDDAAPNALTGFRCARTDAWGGQEWPARVRLKGGRSEADLHADLAALAFAQPRRDQLDAAANMLALADYLLARHDAARAKPLLVEAGTIRDKLLTPKHAAHLEVDLLRAVAEGDGAFALDGWSGFVERAARSVGGDHPLTCFGLLEKAAMAEKRGDRREARAAAVAAMDVLDGDPPPVPRLLIRALQLLSRADDGAVGQGAAKRAADLLLKYPEK